MNLAYLMLMTELQAAIYGMVITPDYWGEMIAVYYKDEYRVVMTLRERINVIRAMAGEEEL